MKKRAIICCGLLFSTSILADAPVVDYSSSAVSTLQPGITKPFVAPATGQIAAARQQPLATSNLSSDQRLNKIEQQINYLNEQNLTAKVEELQQNIQKLNGQLESQNYQIDQLSKQLKDFYQDLSQRVDTKSAGSNSPSTSRTETNQTNAQITLPITNQEQQPTPAPANDNAFLKEQQLYQTAIDLLPDKKHESENKLRDYLKQYPKGTYAANAHYWLGEINFLQKNFDAAEEEFNIVINKYPKSKRLADALLKRALVYQNQGRTDKAKQELNKIIKLYPRTSAAQLAKQQLANN